MTSHDFSNLTPPVEVYCSWGKPSLLIRKLCEKAAQWGAQYAAEKLAAPPLTPEQQEALAALNRLLQNCSDNTGEAALRRFILGETGK